MTLVPDLSVLDNMLLPHAPQGPLGMIAPRAERVDAHLRGLAFEVDLRAEAGALELAQRQKVEIARALWRQPRILLLDEPTSTLAGRDVDWLGGIIERLKRQGVTVVFISHRMREVREFCDRLTILRNGKHISTGPADALSDDEVIGAHYRPQPVAGVSAAPGTADRDAAAGAGGARAGRRRARARDFVLRRGDPGRGRPAGHGPAGPVQRLLRHDAATGGPDPGGRARGRAGVARRRDPAEHRHRHGARGSQDRGLVPEAGWPRQRHAAGGRALRALRRAERRAEGAAVARAFAQVQVDRRADWTPAGAFSGGNQQKIAIAKWLVAQSRILLLFDPTRGIDVGTKHELYLLMRRYVEAGGAILFHSTEIPEIVHLCDRALVLYGGRVQTELAGEALTEAGIMRAALGGSESGRSAA